MDEWLDFVYWWSCIGKGLGFQRLRSRLVFFYYIMIEEDINFPFLTAILKLIKVKIPCYPSNLNALLKTWAYILLKFAQKYGVFFVVRKFIKHFNQVQSMFACPGSVRIRRRLASIIFCWIRTGPTKTDPSWHPKG